MNPTAKQTERLAKIFAIGKDGDHDFWEDYTSPTPTRDALTSFRNNGWTEDSGVKEIDGGYYWDRVQARKGDERYSLAVIDCGDFRLVYQQ